MGKNFVNHRQKIIVNFAPTPRTTWYPRRAVVACRRISSGKEQAMGFVKTREEIERIRRRLSEPSSTARKWSRWSTGQAGDHPPRAAAGPRADRHAARQSDDRSMGTEQLRARLRGGASTWRRDTATTSATTASPCRFHGRGDHLRPRAVRLSPKKQATTNARAPRRSHPRPLLCATASRFLPIDATNGEEGERDEGAS